MIKRKASISKQNIFHDDRSRTRRSKSKCVHSFRKHVEFYMYFSDVKNYSKKSIFIAEEQEDIGVIHGQFIFMKMLIMIIMYVTTLIDIEID